MSKSHLKHILSCAIERLNWLSFELTIDVQAFACPTALLQPPSSPTPAPIAHPSTTATPPYHCLRRNVTMVNEDQNEPGRMRLCKAMPQRHITNPNEPERSTQYLLLPPPFLSDSAGLHRTPLESTGVQRIETGK
ncbi:hypothetical protein K443DRAFT_10638 [Laccaria amethystina LaAM-08-1]|uniref:Uncharacterized protein n=1 Tax=Laccaria amethystina LaAM-08-1 TaxID=1095629 RepID=A0A0C9XJT7_9AGAR|nr:hypothetical protein K443DRAFT_10638 [Laccaria amethystina LaAM-08-1]